MVRRVAKEITEFYEKGQVGLEEVDWSKKIIVDQKEADSIVVLYLLRTPTMMQIFKHIDFSEKEMNGKYFQLGEIKVTEGKH